MKEAGFESDADMIVITRGIASRFFQIEFAVVLRISQIQARCLIYSSY